MILAIETSAEPASIAIQDTRKTFIYKDFPNQNQVNIPIAGELKKILSQTNESVDTILVGAGPGSYSGARVGLATAEAIAIVHNCPVVTLPSLYGIPTPDQFHLIGDARRGSYFIANPDNPTPKVMEKETFIEAVEKLSSPLMSFESPDKLPLSSEIIAKIKPVFSSAKQLLKYWHSLNDSMKQQWLSKPKEVTYLRPPPISQRRNLRSSSTQFTVLLEPRQQLPFSLYR